MASLFGFKSDSVSEPLLTVDISFQTDLAANARSIGFKRLWLQSQEAILTKIWRNKPRMVKITMSIGEE